MWMVFGDEWILNTDECAAFVMRSLPNGGFTVTARMKQPPDYSIVKDTEEEARDLLRRVYAKLTG